MKGIILAGGLGTRLRPLTKIANKHLLPVYDRPMIYFPIEALCKAGIRDIMVVTGGNSAGDFLRLLGNGRQFGLQDIAYTYQEGEGGIAEALGLCEHFADGERVLVMLGDNIFQNDLTPYVRSFQEQPAGARVLLKHVPDPERFGVPEFQGGRITRIIEKPAYPTSSYAVVGVYMYDARVFEYIRQLEPSPRGELEITDVNNFYIRDGLLEYDVIDGWWSDAGTIDGLHRTSRLVAAGRASVFDVSWEGVAADRGNRNGHGNGNGNGHGKGHLLNPEPVKTRVH